MIQQVFRGSGGSNRITELPQCPLGQGFGPAHGLLGGSSVRHPVGGEPRTRTGGHGWSRKGVK